MEAIANAPAKRRTVGSRVSKPMPIPMSSPDLTDAEVAAVTRVLQTPVLSLGPRLVAFEETVASYVGTHYAVGVNSGTSGLHLCIAAAGIGDGDLVITTPFSFIASANCILYERAVPVFVDVDPQTGNIDPALVDEAVEALAQEGSPSQAAHWLPPALRRSVSRMGAGRVKAILPVHAFGQPADMDPILTLAHQHGLAVIEDACEAIGAEYKGRIAGTLGDAAVFAFYPNKQMTTGEGGIIVTDNEEWANVFRSLRNQGRDVFDAWLNHTRLGYNYRLDELSAALGLVQIQRIEELLAKRERVAGWYSERLADVELVERPYITPLTTHMSWFVYVVRIRPPADRDDIMRELADAGIPSRPYFTPIHLQPFYRERFGYKRGDFPVTEHLGDVCLALPFSSTMTEEQVDYVCSQLHAITSKVSGSKLVSVPDLAQLTAELGQKTLITGQS
jgi:perosamine synthetase